MSYEAGRACDRCGMPSPWSPICGECEQNERGFKEGIAEGMKRATAAAVAYLRRALDFGHGDDCYCPLCREVPDVATAIEAGDHLQAGDTGASPGGRR